MLRTSAAGRRFFSAVYALHAPSTLCAQTSCTAASPLSHGASSRRLISSRSGQISWTETCSGAGSMAAREMSAGGLPRTRPQPLLSTYPSFPPSAPRRTKWSKTSQTEYYAWFKRAIPHGPPPHGKFTIDLAALRKEFLSLQRIYHPDRYQFDVDRKQVKGTSTFINQAYRTLEDPLRRAQYLLKLQNIDVAEDERAKTDDLELLETVMEARAAIEAAKEESDLDGPGVENEERITASLQVLEEAFKAEDYERAKTEAIRLKYWRNIRDSIHDWEPGKPIVLIH